ncbi:hypothetical protein PI23P_09230 [Polaribacter irgensii 23-P]|uniref:Uncharacterized protein n=1 Tax=Polaribacter irgensii 23-P TaxID=313594 RepID=A4C055_9FLAO|nr:hypothetical protein PI23P_09230 [Polaribacter irgensii 23-P]
MIPIKIEKLLRYFMRDIKQYAILIFSLLQRLYTVSQCFTDYIICKKKYFYSYKQQKNAKKHF